MLTNKGKNKNLHSLLLLASTVLFVAHYLLPERRIQLHPVANNLHGLYGYIDPQSGQTSHWVDEDKHVWHCNYKPEHLYGCGSDIRWAEQTDEGIDFSGFDALELRITHKGDGKHLRLFVRNYNPNISKLGEGESNKHMYVLLHTDELRSGKVRVALTEFSVSKWWILENNIHRKWASPEFDAITGIGVELAETGDQTVQLKSVALVGPWIRTETLLYTIIIFWMSLFLGEGALRFYQAYDKSKQGRSKVKELLKKQQSLEVEKQYLRTIAKQDPLTGICNRGGLQSQMSAILSDSPKLAVMVLDLDHFKSVNDSYGHDFGDEVLKAFVATISKNIREDDLFVRWGGEEFLVLCQFTVFEHIKEIAEKLRRATTEIEFESMPDFSFSISIGLSVFNINEDFEEAFKRADKALYRAKQTGRNRVEHEI